MQFLRPLDFRAGIGEVKHAGRHHEHQRYLRALTTTGVGARAACSLAVNPTTDVPLPQKHAISR